ncbi:MAG: hypothetical protein ABI781_17405 [Burkholderiales bacterium]
MDSSLLVFVRQFAFAVAAALIPVVLIAFWSIPYSLGGHPGEERRVDPTTQRHMT